MQSVRVVVIANNHPHVAEITLLEQEFTEREVGQFLELLRVELLRLRRVVKDKSDRLEKQHRLQTAEYRRGHMEGYEEGIREKNKK